MPNNEFPVDVVKLRIRVKSFFNLAQVRAESLTMPQDLMWHPSNFSIQRVVEDTVPEGIYDIKLHLPKGECFENGVIKYEALEDLRDHIVATISLIVMMPVYLVDKGAAVWHNDGLRYSCVSLGNMEISGVMGTLANYPDIILGLRTLNIEYLRLSLYYYWQALNANSMVHQFINLVIALELVINAETVAPQSRLPACVKCNSELTSCPECGSSWSKIPGTLQERTESIIKDEELRKEFIKTRNAIFHPSATRFSKRVEEGLYPLNCQLIKFYHDHVAEEFGYKPNDEISNYLKVALENVALIVRFTIPEDSDQDPLAL